MTLSRDDYVRRITESGVLDAAEVEAFLARAPAEKVPDAQNLARELVRAGKLTKYQAAAIYQGKTKGLVIGKYVVLDKIGAGGMGQVFKAVHKRMDRVVALKVLPPEATKSPEAVKRFHREVKAAARLEHPNIVTAHDADEAGGIHFLVMQFADGQDLASLVRDHGPLPIPLAVECMRQAAVGLAYAHRQGVVHRDIKPGNLLLGKDGTVKVLDMGLARLEEQIAEETAARGLTQSGQIMGTVDYMSPEQAEETRSVDGRTDIYSLGCTLYVLLTGRPMYGGTTTIQKLMAHRTAPIPKLRLARADAPAALDDVYHKMVAKEPSDRYATMDEVVEALASCLATPATVEVGKPSSSESQLTEFFQHVSAERKAGPISLTSADAETINHEPRKEETGTAHAMPAETMPPLAKPAAQKLVSNILPVPGAPGSAAAPRAAGKRKSKLPLPLALGGVALCVLLLLGAGAAWFLFSETPPDEPQLQASEEIPASAPETTNTPPAIALANMPAHALQFNGPGTFVTAPLAQEVRLGDFTLEGYVHRNGEATPAIMSAICGIGGTTLGAMPNGLKAWQGALFYGLKEGKYTNSDAAASTKWVHVAFSRTNGVCRLFVDGKLQLIKVTDASEVSAKELFVGAGAKIDADPFYNYYGHIAKVRISTIGRYTANFTPDLNFTPDEHTLALYEFREGEGDVLRDSSGNGHDGKIVGAKWVKVDDAPPLAIAPFDAAAAKQHQQAWADYLGLPVEKEITLPGGEKLAMMLIPPGEFMMGSGEQEQAKFLEEAKAAKDPFAIENIPTESPQNRVRVTKPFYMAKYEVTQQQWQVLTGHNPSAIKESPSHPVDSVSWNDIQMFLTNLNKRVSAAGLKFALPTEAQWEYACRAGTTTAWHSGDSEKPLEEYGWFSTNSDGKSHPVGRLRANGFGLYDMHGNAAEWCFDWHADKKSEQLSVNDPTGPFTGRERVRRGGSWGHEAGEGRSARRAGNSASARYTRIGFRLAAAIDVEAALAKKQASAAIDTPKMPADETSLHALTFDGVDDCVEAPSVPFDAESDLTVEVWARNRSKGFGSLIGLFNPHTKTHAGLWFQDKRAGFAWVAEPKAQFRTDRNNAGQDWVHVAGVRKQDKYFIFVNGRQAAFENPGNISGHAFTGLLLGRTERPRPMHFFSGEMREVRISKVARYEEDFTPPPFDAQFTPDANTLALYHFDEGEGDVLRDSSGNNHHGKIVGAKWVPAAGKNANVSLPANSR